MRWIDDEVDDADVEVDTEPVTPGSESEFEPTPGPRITRIDNQNRNQRYNIAGLQLFVASMNLLPNIVIPH